MSALLANCISLFFAILTHNMLSPVNGQCTVEGCEIGASANEIATEIQEIQIQQHNLITSLRVVSEFLTKSLQQIKDQQDALDRRLLEQDIYNRQQVRGIYEFLNASFEQTKNQQVNAMTSLVVIDRRLKEHDIFVRDKTEIILELTNAFGTGDWIVIMHRFNESLDFNRTWIEYRNGFGDKARGEFWLGNEKVHYLTSRFNCTLRIEVQFNQSGEWKYAEYSTFTLGSEDNKYAIHLSGFSGNAFDGLTHSSFLSTTYYHGGMNFSTWDRDNDRSSNNCAQKYSSGWWFDACLSSCLTCKISFRWYILGGTQSSVILRSARMMIKSN